MISRPIATKARVGAWGLAVMLLAAAVLLPMAIAQRRAEQTQGMAGAQKLAQSEGPAGVQADPNLIAWWKLDEGMGAVVKDSSSNVIDGNFVGDPQWTAGVDGGALWFDGASGVDFGNPEKTALTGPLTIACWIRPLNLGVIPRATGGLQDRAFVARDEAYVFKASGPNLRFTTPSILDHEAARTFLTLDQWQHVAVTFQPGEMGGCVFYLGGVETDRVDASILMTGTGPVRIAYDQWPGGQFYTGMIDDVRLYNRILTGDEIASLLGPQLFAHNPQPPQGGRVSQRNASVLSWSPGDTAVQHDVYLGLAEATVRGADLTSPLYWGRLTRTSFSVAGKLEVGAVYFWRIDEVEADGLTLHKGPVWKFFVSR